MFSTIELLLGCHSRIDLRDGFTSLLDGQRDRVILLDHPAGHQSAFVFGDDDFVGAGAADGVGVALLAGAGDDFDFGVEGARSDGDVEVVGVVIDDDADAAGAVDAGLEQDVVTLGVTLNDGDFVRQQLAVEAFVGFDQDEGDLEALQLVDDGAADLAVAADDEMVAEAVDVDFVDHGSPGLHAVAAENCEQDALGDPDLQGENSGIDEYREDLGGLVDGAVFNRMG